MAWQDELEKLQRVRRAFVRYAQEFNPTGGWIGDTDRRYGKTADSTGDIPVVGHVDSFGTYNNALANHEFAIEVPSIRTTLLDPYNEWRLQADRPSNTLLQRKLAYYLRQHDDNDDILDELIAIGVISSPNFPPGKVALNLTIPGGDLLGEDVGRRLLTTEDWPRALPEHLGRVIPFAYGHLSNNIVPVIIVDEEPTAPPGEAEWNPCGCAQEDAVVGANIWALNPVDGDAFDPANRDTPPENPSGPLWAFTSNNYPDALNTFIRQNFVVNLAPGAGPAGETCLTPDLTVSTGYNDSNYLYISPAVTNFGYSTPFGPAVDYTGWDASSYRLSYDMKFESSYINYTITNGQTGSNFFGVWYIRGSGGISSWAIQYAPIIGGLPTPYGPDYDANTLTFNTSLSFWQQPFGQQGVNGAIITVPMDTWCHWEFDMHAATWTGSAFGTTGCIRVAVTPEGGDTIEIYRLACRRYTANQLNYLPAGYWSDYDSSGPLVQPDYNYVSALHIGAFDVGFGGSKGSVFLSCNWRADAITLEDPGTPPEEGEESSAPSSTVVFSNSPICSESDGVNDQGAAGRGGWLKALLVDTGGGNPEISDYGVPAISSVEILPSDPGPVLSAVVQSGGLGAATGTAYYAAVSLNGGVMSELSNIVSVSYSSGQKVHLTFTAGGDYVRIYRSETSTFEAYDTYRVTGYPYAVSDTPTSVGFVDDLYPGYDTRNEPPTPDGGDPHWDLTYRQTEYYYVSALFADGTESECSLAGVAELFPRTMPLNVRVTWTAPAAGDVEVTGYRVRRASQRHHFEPGFDREWVFDSTQLSFDDPLTDTTAVSACATAPTGTGTTGDQKPTYCLTGHTLKAVNEVFVLKPDPESETNEFVQVLMTEGVDYTDEVIERNGNRYHCLVFNEQQRSETCQYYEVSANVDGVETEADGTGDLLTNADDIFEHILLNIIFNTYRSSVGQYAPVGGKYFNDVEYSPGLFDRDSVQEAKIVADLRVPGGYLGAGALVEKTPARQLIYDLLVSYDLDFYQFNGSWHVKRFGNVSRATLPVFDPNLIIKDTFEPELDQSKQVNLIPFFAGPIGGGENEGYLISGEIQDDASIELYRRVIISEPIYLLWTQDPATANSVIREYLKRWRYPVINAKFEGAIQWLTLPPSAEVLITHPYGLGPAGWVERACRILAMDLDLDSLTCRVTVREVDDLIP